MSDIFVEQPPLDTDIALKEYLSRMFGAVGIALRMNQDMTPIYTHPDKFKIGKIYYYGAPIDLDAVVTEEGLYVYKSTGLVKII